MEYKGESSYVGLRCGIRAIPRIRVLNLQYSIGTYFQSSDERRDGGSGGLGGARSRPVRQTGAPWAPIGVRESRRAWLYLYNLYKKEKENDLTHVSRRVLLLVRVAASASSI